MAVDFFHVNNPASIELARLQDLFDVGLTFFPTSPFISSHLLFPPLLTPPPPFPSSYSSPSSFSLPLSLSPPPSLPPPQQGLDTLQRDFMNMIKRSSKPVAVAILNDIALCEDIEGQFCPCLLLCRYSSFSLQICPHWSTCQPVQSVN